MYKLCFYVPKTHVETVKDAVFEAGAGQIGHYDRCSWEVAGRGQFRPLPGSQPFLGEANQTEVVEEMRVEMVVAKERIQAVIQALKAAHPFETPAYDVMEVIDL
ncbi:YqfO family protein [Thiomicrospira sp. WB1]|uniref:Nif3-like dinuclear metal center hexameric protein n=1 Tax=Thiomicrospira sp. WB1 TaxID=1685380 RepID=UPI0007461180|nr:YqfO family protein [Thiomicrospira sp. WB1]KUJ71890.1 NGG1p interacting factor NIF3 [Thiomicrospira sp. WB1]